MKGMTGYGRAKVDNKRYAVVAEISSVNKRHLDIAVRLPRAYQQTESSLRKNLSSKIFRGSIAVTISVSPLEASAVLSPINWPMVKAQEALLREIAEHVGCPFPAERAAIELWRQQISTERASEEADPEIEALIVRAVDDAFVEFDKRRLSEGAFLGSDIRNRLSILRELKARIAQNVEGGVELIRQRLTALVEKHVPSLASDDRLLREVVLYADRADVSEELSRIDHHLDHVNAAIQETSASGKLLEFVLQELLREFNTLGSKATSSEVSTAVVLAKTELEKMREQVQNVE